MKKLNQRKIRWIIRELQRGQLSIYQISRIQKVSPRWVRQIPTKYKGVPLYKIKLRKCGRKPKPITDAERQQVMTKLLHFIKSDVKTDLVVSDARRRLYGNF